MTFTRGLSLGTQVFLGTTLAYGASLAKEAHKRTKETKTATAYGTVFPRTPQVKIAPRKP